jgi:hypothetical protein
VLGGIVTTAAIAMRLPLVVSTRPLGYDDGVYAASVMAMRNGATPFQDIFSSQGPVFLPTLRLFDIVGFQQPWAPRLAMLAAGVTIGLAVFAIALHITKPLPAAAFGVAATTSGAVIVASGPLESDGLALAFGLTAFAVACSAPRPRMSSILIGVLSGLALATKSLLIAPAVVAALWLLWKRHSGRAATAAFGAALLTGLMVTLPFGLAEVWDQYVGFQRAVSRDISPLESAGYLGAGLMRREAVIVGLAAIGAVDWWRRRRRLDTGDAGSPLRSAATIWTIGSLAIVLLTTDLNSGYLRYVAFFTVPIVLLIATLDTPPKLILIGFVVLLPIHLALNADRLHDRELGEDARQAVEMLETLPAGSLVVGDEPAMLYAAGRASPPWLTDTSFARIRAGYLTETDIVDALASPETCALLIWSGRFRELAPDLADTAEGLGYTDRTDYEPGHTLLRRGTCAE